MIVCKKCGKNYAAKAIGLCAGCLRNLPDGKALMGLHAPARQEFGLPSQPPQSANGVACRFCGNECRMAEGEMGFCGLRRNQGGRLVNRVPKGSALAYMYLDPLPANCCAAWFCSGSCKKGYNLAVFFYGCSFNCLFCQNASHKLLKKAPVVTEDEMVRAALDSRVRCACFFGGSPEPQLSFALRVARRIIQESGNSKHICWEWNGCGNSKLVKKAAELAAISGGTVKFDLKAFHPHISYALCGVSNQPALENFASIARKFPRRDLLTATTLMVPYYVDQQEVEAIAKFIAKCCLDIPYSLLVFHPHFYLRDLPITPRQQVRECYEATSQYLSRVNIGNKHLLPYAE